MTAALDRGVVLGCETEDGVVGVAIDCPGDTCMTVTVTSQRSNPSWTNST